MSRIEKLIHRLRQKPDHVRQRIALGTSVGITAVVGLIWVTTMATSGVFALNSSGNKPDLDGQAPSSDAFALSGTNVKSNFSQLVGAVGAVTGGTSTDPALTIIDGTTTSSISQSQSVQQSQNANNNSSATVIPF